MIASLEVLIPGTKINGLFGFNRLSSDILFDICIEKTEFAISFCQSIALLYYCLFRYYFLFRKRTITTVQENSKPVTYSDLINSRQYMNCRQYFAFKGGYQFIGM